MTKSYIYSDTGRILCQRDGGQSADEYFYVTDRLGSVRQVVGIVDSEPAIVLSYTYSPFGQMVEQGKKTGFEYSFNSFLFTGQWFDDEFGQYYLRARMYDPVLGRFTSRDPVFGKYNDPMTLHPYLYCLNDPVNHIDPTGKSPLLDILFGSTTGAKMREMSLAMGARAFGFAGRLYTAAYVRAAAINVFIGQVMYGSGGSGFNADQKALIELAKQVERTGTTRETAKILMRWAAEYGIPFRDDTGASHWIMEHIHIWSYHIGLFN